MRNETKIGRSVTDDQSEFQAEIGPDALSSDAWTLPMNIGETKHPFFAEVCSHCGGKMRIVAAVTDFVSIKRYLDGVGLPSEIPEVKPARPPPQLDIEYDDLEYADG